MERIVVDWGSSRFRAYRFGADGSIASSHKAEAGILTVDDRAFEAVLMREIGAWITAGSEILLSGMITSRNGWVETPYLDVPAGLAAVAAGAVSRRLAGGAHLRFLPGVCVRTPVPDVMRGEEIQVFGSVGAGEDAVVVLPGTHSKWVVVRDGMIVDFRTFFTGETFALLRRHSMIGTLAGDAAAPFDEGAFRDGVRQAAASSSLGLLNDAFTIRAGTLLGQFPADAIADRLSGVLIGHELKAALRLLDRADGRPLLVGDAALMARYACAFSEFGYEAGIGAADAAVDGFRRLAGLED